MFYIFHLLFQFIHFSCVHPFEPFFLKELFSRNKKKTAELRHLVMSEMELYSSRSLFLSTPPVALRCWPLLLDDWHDQRGGARGLGS